MLQRKKSGRTWGRDADERPKKKDEQRKQLKQDPVKYKEYLKNQAEARKVARRASNETALNTTPLTVQMSFPSLLHSLKRVKRSLPQKQEQKTAVVRALMEDAIQATPRKKRIISRWLNIRSSQHRRSGRPPVLTDEIKEKLDGFLCRNDTSYTLPGLTNQYYVGKNEEGQRMYKPKEFLLWTFNELREILAAEEDNDLSSLKFSTIYRYVKSKKEYIIQGKIPGISSLCPDCERY